MQPSEASVRLPLHLLTADELDALQVAIDKQREAGIGNDTEPVDLPSVGLALRDGLVAALDEIAEHNAETKYHTGRNLENQLRALVGLPPLPLWSNPRHNSSHY